MLSSAAELDEALEADVKEECVKHGPVQRVVVVSDPLIPTATDQVRLFVLFDTVDGATKARDALDHRWFGGQVVHVEYIEEQYVPPANIILPKSVSSSSSLLFFSLSLFFFTVILPVCFSSFSVIDFRSPF